MNRKPIPPDIFHDMQDLSATVRGCDDALSSELELWERKEFQQTRDRVFQNLSARVAAIESAGYSINPNCL